MSNLTEIRIRLKGCDDDTFVVVKVAPAFALALQEIALRTQEASNDRCMPTMHILEVENV